VLSADPKGNPLAADAKFIGWATYAVVGPGLFVGQLLVVERELGLLALKRALPMPFGAYLTAKVLLALVFAVVVMAVLAPLGLLFGQVAFTPGGWAAVIGILLLGVAPACAISLFIGAWAPPQSAPTLTNGVYVLMVFFGCAIFPTPPAMQALKPLWPTYHLVQLATAAAGLPSHGALWVHVAALTGLTVVLWLLAVHRMRRAR
jgi:ABC-2 type transport system permease protein